MAEVADGTVGGAARLAAGLVSGALTTLHGSGECYRPSSHAAVFLATDSPF